MIAPARIDESGTLRGSRGPATHAFRYPASCKPPVLRAPRVSGGGSQPGLPGGCCPSRADRRALRSHGRMVLAGPPSDWGQSQEIVSAGESWRQRKAIASLSVGPDRRPDRRPCRLARQTSLRRSGRARLPGDWPSNRSHQAAY